MKYIQANRWCWHKDHPRYKKTVKYGDCANCPFVLLLEDWEPEEDG